MLNNQDHLSKMAGMRELTLRGMLLGAVITLLFTAANVYLGLKVGLTFASSIPAAVISMAVLKFFKGSNILENNMVQTQASAAGCLSSIIFVLPGMLMLGYWQGFPFWQIMLICAAGGILGVIFTIPLRQVMVVESKLPYPEGVAAAEILKAGDAHSNQEECATSPKEGMRLIVRGGALSGIMALLTGGFRVVADSVAVTFNAGAAIFNLQFGFSFALLGAGFLVGITGGIAMMVGTIIAWCGGVPIISSIFPADSGVDLSSYAVQVWATKVRYIGAGCIAVAAIWVLFKLAKPLIDGMKMSVVAFKSKDSIPRERIFHDLSLKTMLWISFAMLVILSLTMWSFVVDSGFSFGLFLLLVFISIILAYVIGFLVAAACGYMAGLIGSSSSPISGICIISVIVVSAILLGVGNLTGIFESAGGTKFMTALVMMTVAIVLAISAISNDNMQDLKTGYLVGATPWRQQVALIIGCIVGAFVIAPVLELLYQAYGFTGAMPREGMDPSLALSAPQANLMATIADGIFTHQLEWTYVIIGTVLGVVVILIDVLLNKSSNGRLALPPLAVGLGIYLPPSIVTPIFFGGLIAWFVSRVIKFKHQGSTYSETLKEANHRGTLLAAGLIVGESLIGVLIAMIIMVSSTTGGSDNPIAIGFLGHETIATAIGLMLFIAAIAYIYKKIMKKS